MTKKDDLSKNISNIVVSRECFKVLQHMKIDDDVSIQEVCSKILESFASKRIRKEDSIIKTI